MTLMGIVFIMVRSAERLNNLGGEHWESFATQNYFDKRGIFISLMVSAPLLCVSVLMLIAFLREASGLLVEVKTHEFKAKAKAKNAAEKGKKSGKKSKKQD